VSYISANKLIANALSIFQNDGSCKLVIPVKTRSYFQWKMYTVSPSPSAYAMWRHCRMNYRDVTGMLSSQPREKGRLYVMYIRVMKRDVPRQYVYYPPPPTMCPFVMYTLYSLMYGLLPPHPPSPQTKTHNLWVHLSVYSLIYSLLPLSPQIKTPQQLCVHFSGTA